MAGLGRSHKEAVARLLQQRKTQVKFSRLWQAIYERFEIGHIDNRHLIFSSQERESLRQSAIKEWGFDPRDKVPDGSRSEIARYSTDDKLSTEKPNDNYLLIKTAQGDLPSCFGVKTLPLGYSLRISLSVLDYSAIKQIIIIENQDCYDLWHQFNLPQEFKNVLTFYRGHDVQAKAIFHLIDKLLPETQVIVFPDYDPSGLQIACTTIKSTHLLIPELIPELVAKNNSDDFYAQLDDVTYLDKKRDKNELGGWQDVWLNIKKNHYSIKQQHMLAFYAPLYTVERKSIILLKSSNFKKGSK